MKKTLLATAVILTAAAAHAGGLSDPVVVPPVMAPEVITADAASSANMEWLIPLFFVLMWVTISSSAGSLTPG